MNTRAVHGTARVALPGRKGLDVPHPTPGWSA
jgi:hypothetical protein